jgi:hypothetical protein
MLKQRLALAAAHIRPKNPERDVVPKGELYTGIWLRTRRRLMAVAAVVLASGAVPAIAQKKSAAAPEPAARGAVVQFEEKKQSSIVYLEETGGMMMRSAAPVAPESDEAPKAARTASNPEDRSTSTSTGTSARRTPQRGDAGVAK